MSTKLIVGLVPVMLNELPDADPAVDALPALPALSA